MWVLNIDDDQEDRELFCDAIQDIDPSIHCVGKDSAEDAIEFLKTNNAVPDYIFLDINMPRMGGFECLKEIKQVDKLASIPVIILSTSCKGPEIEQFKKMGADFIRKETSYAKYVNLLRSKLRNNYR
jgi:CheY-like chemotaxis protein